VSANFNTRTVASRWQSGGEQEADWESANHTCARVSPRVVDCRSLEALRRRSGRHSKRGFIAPVVVKTAKVGVMEQFAS
jgi:hypothetical protein